MPARPQVYRKDLDLHPDNGWALRGLADTLEAQKDAAGARRVSPLRPCACMLPLLPLCSNEPLAVYYRS